MALVAELLSSTPLPDVLCRMIHDELRGTRDYWKSQYDLVVKQIKIPNLEYLAKHYKWGYLSPEEIWNEWFSGKYYHPHLHFKIDVWNQKKLPERWEKLDWTNDSVEFCIEEPRFKMHAHHYIYEQRANKRRKISQTQITNASGGENRGTTKEDERASCETQQIAELQHEGMANLRFLRQIQTIKTNPPQM